MKIVLGIYGRCVPKVIYISYISKIENGLSMMVGVPLKCIILDKVEDGLGIHGRCAFKAIYIGQFWK